ncbi:MAG: VOC family protein [Bacteroidota bacterium]
MKNGNPVVWFEIYADDLQRARKFYETVLQVELMELPSPTTWDKLQMLAFPSNMEAHGTSGALAKMEGVKAGNNSTLVYFFSEDCSIEEARIERAGGSVVTSKTSIGENGFMVIAIDTEGNTFGIHSMK